MASESLVKARCSARNLPSVVGNDCLGLLVGRSQRFGKYDHTATGLCRVRISPGDEKTSMIYDLFQGTYSCENEHFDSRFLLASYPFENTTNNGRTSQENSNSSISLTYFNLSGFLYPRLNFIIMFNGAVKINVLYSLRYFWFRAAIKYIV